MPKRPSAVRILTGHFFRRFFDNDTLQVEGDTVTTVVRAVAAVAVPGLMVAFFLQNQYPARTRWGAIEDQCFLVLLSFAVMGLVTIVEWEMLFPDRTDFLILSPLPVKPREMLTAKAAALAGFVALFLFGTNALSTLMYPLVAKSGFWWPAIAQAVGVGMAGVFAALSFVALSGVLRCVLGTPQFRIASPVLQMLAVMALVLLLLGYFRFGDSLEAMLSGPLGVARWLPPMWFLALYDRLLYGDGAPAFARELTPYAVRATLGLAAVVLITYPLAWERMRRAALEGSAGRQRRPMRWFARLTHAVVRRPAERAVFHFLGQTIRRNTRYQVYLAMYCGTGLALALACSVGVRAGGGLVEPVLSERGLRAVMPLLLFWVIAGLRTAFAFPLNLGARWVFRVAGSAAEGVVDAPRRWALVAAVGVGAAILPALGGVGFGAREVLVQAVCGLCLCVLLTDGFFFRPNVPFTQPRLPGRVNFPLMLTLYIGVLPLFVFGMALLAERLERRLWELLAVLLGTAVVHAGLRRLARGPMEMEEEMEGYEGEFQLLNLR